MPVIGDIAVSADGRRLQWESRPAHEWKQKAEISFQYSRNTYKFDRNAGFLDTIEIFASAITAETIANLARYHLLSRKGLAEVYFVKVDRDAIQTRDWRVRAAVKLLSGDTATLQVGA